MIFILAVGWIKRSESTVSQNIAGGFGAKTNALIHPTHNLLTLQAEEDRESRESSPRFY